MQNIALNILKQLKNPFYQNRSKSPMACLHVEVLSAKGIQVDVTQIEQLQIHILFGGKIFRSQEYIGIAEPIFNFEVDFDLDDSVSQSLNHILKITDPVVIYITSTRQNEEDKNFLGLSSTKTLMSAALIDFRYSLLYTGNYISVELLPCEVDGINMGSLAGILFLRLSIIHNHRFEPHEQEEEEQQQQ